MLPLLIPCPMVRGVGRVPIGPTFCPSVLFPLGRRVAGRAALGLSPLYGGRLLSLSSSSIGMAFVQLRSVLLDRVGIQFLFCSRTVVVGPIRAHIRSL